MNGFFGLSLSTGEVLWQSAAVEGDLASGRHSLFLPAAAERAVDAVDAVTGDVTRVPIPTAPRWVEAVGETLVVWTNEPEINDRQPAFGFDIRTGQRLWRNDYGRGADAIVVGEQLVVAQESLGIAGYETVTGKRLWLVDAAVLEVAMFDSLWASGGHVFASVDRRRSFETVIVGIDTTTGRLVFEHAASDPSLHPFVHDGVAIVGGAVSFYEIESETNGWLTGIRLSDGEALWTTTLRDAPRSAVVQGGRVVVVAADGTRFCD